MGSKSSKNKLKLNNLEKDVSLFDDNKIISQNNSDQEKQNLEPMGCFSFICCFSFNKKSKETTDVKFLKYNFKF